MFIISPIQSVKLELVFQNDNHSLESKNFWISRKSYILLMFWNETQNSSIFESQGLNSTTNIIMDYDNVALI